MFKKSRKLIILVIAVTMLLTMLISCSKTNNTTPTNTTTQEKTASPSTAAPENPPEKTIKWEGKISVAPYMFAQIEEDIITPMIEERLLEYGYDVELENVYIENGQYTELLNIRISSDDAPDIFQPRTVTNLYQYYKQGAIASWTEEFFRENAPISSAFWDNGGPGGVYSDISSLIWEVATIEGKMVNVPSVAVTANTLLHPMYNKEWLDNLGLKAPETIDDFVDLMYKFKNNDPNQSGKNDTYVFVVR